MQIELVQISLPRRNSINTEGKYTQKPRVMQTCLQLPRRTSICGEAEFRRSREQCKLVCNYRGAQVYAAKPNSAEAESNANLFAITEAHKYMRRSRIPQKPRAMQTMIICTPLFQSTSKASIAMPRAL